MAGRTLGRHVCNMKKGREQVCSGQTIIGWNMLQSLFARLTLRYPWLAAPFLLCGGCNLFAETVSPMPLQIFGDPDKADQVVVMLPGIRDRGSDFIVEGFVEDARPLINEGRLALVVADAHVGYYRDRTVTQRLVEDILDRWPRRKLGFAGISLGGFGALTVARQHPGRIDSLLLLAPFLGEKPFLQRVASGRPQPMQGDEPLQQELVHIWQFLLGKDIPDITLAYGRDDSFMAHYTALRRLGADFPMPSIEGGHNWNTWRTLWRQWLKGLP